MGCSDLCSWASLVLIVWVELGKTPFQLPAVWAGHWSGEIDAGGILRCVGSGEAAVQSDFCQLQCTTEWVQEIGWVSSEKEESKKK